MTYSIVARCPKTGEYGVGIATYSPNVGVRCPVVVPQRGAASLQAVANPYLLPIAKRLMASALSAEKIVDELLASDPYPQTRQIAVVDVYGRAYAFTGEKNPVWAGHIVGDGFAVAGNVLAGEGVVKAMAKAFEGGADQVLAERLMRAVEAGRDAGGQPKGKTRRPFWSMVINPSPWSICGWICTTNLKPSCAACGTGSARWCRTMCSVPSSPSQGGGNGAWTMSLDGRLAI